MRQTQAFATHKPLNQIADQISAWIATEQKFPVPERTMRGSTIVLRTKLTGVLRHMAGLVFELSVELTPNGDGFLAEVDNGDIRKQLAAMGVAWFLFWPALLTAGYGWLANNETVHATMAKLGEFAG